MLEGKQEKKSFFERLKAREPKKPVEEKLSQKIKPKVDTEEKKTTPPKKEEWLKEEEGQLSIDVYQTPQEIVIKSTIAGVKPEDLDVSINDDMATIRGERKKDVEVPDENYFYQECYWGKFSRSVILPQEVDVDKVKAEIQDGILTIKLPKLEKAKSKKIQVIAKQSS